MNKKIIRLLLISILVLAFGLRVYNVSYTYKISEVPPSISWDEAAVGVNGWTIANFGRDEYGKFLPLIFRSFGEDKHPVLIYITAISEKIFGINEFGTRFPAALFGSLNVLLIFFLCRLYFKNDVIGLIAALFLAISPYNIDFSRFSHEANLALFFFMLGLILFYLFFKKNTFLLSLALLSFGISFITYLPAKIITTLMVIILFSLYFKEIIKNKKGLYGSVVVISIFALLFFFNSHLIFSNRISQTLQGDKEIQNIYMYKNTHSLLLGRLNLIITQYSWHFSPQFLFIQGDKNPRLSSQTGEFYKIDVIFLILGLIYLIHKRSRASIVLLTWALVAPLPSALVAEAPHAGRAMFMMGSWHLISALGFYLLINLFKKPAIKWVTAGVTLIVLTASLSSYLTYYYNEYAKRYAIDWQYGMKQIVEYVKIHPEYSQVFMTDVRSQPYIFFLYYLKMPFNEYLNTVVYNNSESKSYNNVSYFGRYFFAGWDPIESFPNKGVVYIVSPSQYDGLRYKSSFEVKKKVVYPNGLDAFFIVSAK